MNRSVNIKYRCRICGYTYDPEKGDEKRAISRGVRFEDLPDSWRCPVCYYPKSQFYTVKDGYRQKV
jgi:rubredoxin